MHTCRVVILVLSLNLSAWTCSKTSHSAEAKVACATPDQVSTIAEAVARLPAALPNILSEETGISEAILVTGLDPKDAIGIDGSGFAKVWETITAWERPAFLVPLDKHNMLEIFGRVGPHISEEPGAVVVDVEGSGIGGHFHPASIASIYMVRIPRGGNKTAQGLLLFNAEGRTLLAIYSIDSPTSPILSILHTNAYQRTWDLLTAMPRVCPR